MSSFTTFNQFDKRFSDFEKFGGDRSACPLFGLISCYNFMDNGDVSQKQHEKNLYLSVTNYMVGNFPKYMTFDELLTGTSLNSNEINATSPELITGGILGYDNIFKFGYEQNYCILFLKNRNYIAVFCVKDTFHVRDCHENTQRNFTNFFDLQTFLNNTYQFEQMTIVDGVPIPEFSNIEYIVIDQPFELGAVDLSLYDETVDIDQSYKEEPAPPIYTIQSNNTSQTKLIQFDNDYQFALSMQIEGAGDDYVDFI